MTAIKYHIIVSLINLSFLFNSTDCFSFAYTFNVLISFLLNLAYIEDI